VYTSRTLGGREIERGLLHDLVAEVLIQAAVVGARLKVDWQARGVGNATQRAKECCAVTFAMVRRVRGQ
jgi:hypothetical protein